MRPHHQSKAQERRAARQLAIYNLFPRAGGSHATPAPQERQINARTNLLQRLQRRTSDGKPTRALEPARHSTTSPSRRMPSLDDRRDLDNTSHSANRQHFGFKREHREEVPVAGPSAWLDHDGADSEERSDSPEVQIFLPEHGGWCSYNDSEDRIITEGRMEAAQPAFLVQGQNPGGGEVQMRSAAPLMDAGHPSRDSEMLYDNRHEDRSMVPDGGVGTDIPAGRNFEARDDSDDDTAVVEDLLGDAPLSDDGYDDGSEGDDEGDGNDGIGRISRKMDQVIDSNQEVIAANLQLSSALNNRSDKLEAHGGSSGKVGSTRKSKRRHGSPRRRGDDANQFNKLIRDHLDRLLNGRSPLIRSVGLDEIAEFNDKWEQSDGTAVACNAHNFRISIDSTPGCPWNTSAKRVFASDFIKRHEDYEDHLEVRVVIEKAFVTHLKSLKRGYDLAQKSSAERRQRKSISRRGERKSKLYQRRREMAKQYESLKPHFHMLEKLGPVAMSSDESDLEGYRPVYHIRTPIWRAPELRQWLSYFDKMYNYSRSADNGVQQDRRGSQPHFRKEPKNERRAVTSAPKRLPLCFYSPAWLATKSKEWIKYELQPNEEEEYEFEHDPEFKAFIDAEVSKCSVDTESQD